MNWHRYFSPVKKPVQACLAGSGGFGHSFLAQCQRTPLLECRAAVDLDAQIVVQAMCSVGVQQQDIRVCRDRASARRAWDAGLRIAADDLDVLLGLPLDILVEATGSPVAGARHAALAIEAGLHVALVSKEVDSVVGPGLAHKARALGRVVTTVDGDQPNLLIGLVTWAQVLGLEIIAAGKSSEYDFVFDPATERMTSNGQTCAVPGFAAWWDQAGRPTADVVAHRSRLCAAFVQRPVPDFCELQIVANATGLTPDLSSFHAPILRTCEVPSVLRLQSEGGLLNRSGVLDIFHCLREPGELSFAGGVFLVVRCHDRTTWDMLAEKGHVLAEDRKTALLYLPRHLLGLEAATSVLEAGGLGVASGADSPRPVLDLVARAEVDLPAGTRLTMGGHHHTIPSLAPALVPAAPLADHAPMPFYLLADGVLRRPVRAGSLVCLADVQLDEASLLFQLRRHQDAAFSAPPSGVEGRHGIRNALA